MPDRGNRIFAINMYGTVAVNDPSTGRYDVTDMSDPKVISLIPERDQPLAILWQEVSKVVFDGSLVARAERYSGQPGYVMVEVELVLGTDPEYRAFEKRHKSVSRKRWDRSPAAAKHEVRHALGDLMRTLTEAGFDLHVLDDVERFSLGAVVESVERAKEAAEIMGRYLRLAVLAPYVTNF